MMLDIPKDGLITIFVQLSSLLYVIILVSSRLIFSHLNFMLVITLIYNQNNYEKY